MRILLVGATGTIGSAIATALDARGHTVVSVSASHGPLRVDIARKASIEALYEAAPTPLDAVVCAAGVAEFGRLETLGDEDFRHSIDSKLMGQVNLVRLGLRHVVSGGSFTLTSGGLSQAPTVGSTAVAMTGAGVEAFAKAAALDLEGRHRVNVVSPEWVAESRVKAGLDPMPGIWAADLAAYYVHCIEDDFTGRILAAARPWPG